MRILGISAHYHDSAAALIRDGEVAAAAQEERFSRRKHDSGFPLRAARYCLEAAGLGPDDLDAIAWYEKPFWKFDRIVTGLLAEAPRGLGRFVEAIPAWLTRRLWVRAEIERALETRVPVRFLPHHESHAASAYGPSPFAEAAVLTLDGAGEWTTNALWSARGPRLAPLAEIRYPHSLGLLYSAFTAYCGFEVNDGEYKLMGLAPYGRPRYATRILERVLRLEEDGSYLLAPEFFAYRHADSMTSPAFHALFGGPPRAPDGPITERIADLAASVQLVVEEALLRQARWARRRTGARALCLAGGVALNCVANGRLAREGIFDRLWIQPAAGDAGAALGAAYALWLREASPARSERSGDAQRGSLLGPEYDEARIRCALEHAGLPHERLALADLAGRVADGLARGEVIGWFQGRMEYGPRALGNRSILADPRDRAMQRRLNEAVKFREGFRPFAPVVREGSSTAWFDLAFPSPYMLLTAPVRGSRPSPDPAADLAAGRGAAAVESPIPAATHVDGSARVQTVAAGSNPPLEALLDAFEARTGCPVLLNTSFNVRGEPIACSPEDAVRTFERAGIDRLAIGPFLVSRGAGRGAGDPPPASRTRSPRRVVRPAAEAGAGLLASLGLLAAGVSPPLAALPGTAGVGLWALGLVHPRGRERLQRLLGRLASAAARAIAWPLLAVVFVAVGVPFGRRRRQRPGPAESAWMAPADPDHDPARPG